MRKGNTLWDTPSQCRCSELGPKGDAAGQVSSVDITRARNTASQSWERSPHGACRAGRSLHPGFCLPEKETLAVTMTSGHKAQEETPCSALGGGQPWDPRAWAPPRAGQRREQSSAAGCSSRCTPSPSYPPSSKWLYFSLEFPKFSYCCDTWQALTVLVEDPHVSNSLLTVTNPCQFQTDNFYLC